MKNKILIITDSYSHNSSDDFFALVQEFKIQDNEVYILDRAIAKNNLFFNAQLQKKLYIYQVKNQNITFQYYQNNFSKTISNETFDFDLIFLRIDRPLNNNFLNFIDTFFEKSFIINNPLGIITTASKEFLFQIKDNCPPMKLCTDYKEIQEFSKLFPIVIKPLENYGGKGICRIFNSNYYIENKIVTKEKFKNYINELLLKEKKVLAVKFLKNIHKGDKRIYVVNGNIIGAINRIPCEGSWLGNIQAGAKIEKAIITDQDKIIIKNINKALQNQGIFIYGADILLDDNNISILSEINTLNVGGCKEISFFSKNNCIKKVVNAIDSILHNK